MKLSWNCQSLWMYYYVVTPYDVGDRINGVDLTIISKLTNRPESMLTVCESWQCDVFSEEWIPSMALFTEFYSFLNLLTTCLVVLMMPTQLAELEWQRLEMDKPWMVIHGCFLLSISSMSSFLCFSSPYISAHNDMAKSLAVSSITVPAYPNTFTVWGTPYAFGNISTPQAMENTVWSHVRLYSRATLGWRHPTRLLDYRCQFPGESFISFSPHPCKSETRMSADFYSLFFEVHGSPSWSLYICTMSRSMMVAVWRLATLWWVRAACDIVWSIIGKGLNPGPPAQLSYWKVSSAFNILWQPNIKASLGTHPSMLWVW